MLLRGLSMKYSYSISLSIIVLATAISWLWFSGTFHNRLLKHAAENRNWEKIIKLIHHGANPNIYLNTKKTNDPFNFSPLTAAIKDKRLDAINELLKHGANPRQPGPFGIGSLHQAIRTHDKTIIKLLLDNGANPNESNRMNDIPVWAFLGDQDFDTLVLLVQAGADVTEKQYGKYVWDHEDYTINNPRAHAYLKSIVEKATSPLLFNKHQNEQRTQ